MLTTVEAEALWPKLSRRACEKGTAMRDLGLGSPLYQYMQRVWKAGFNLVSVQYLPQGANRSVYFNLLNLGKRVS